VTVLLLMLLAHGLADFVLQSDRTVQRKESRNWRGFLGHGLMVFITGFLLLIGYEWPKVLLYVGIMTIIHIMIDMAKIALGSRRPGNDFLWFLGDQLLHLAFIVFVWQYFTFQPSGALLKLGKWLLTPAAVETFGRSMPEEGVKLHSILACLIIYLYICWGGGFFVKKALASLQDQALAATSPSQKDRLQHTGFWIGALERFIIITLVLNHALTAVAFIFTAKSIARFSELNDKTFAEYYLTGTLLSTALGITGGYFLLWLMSA